MERQLVHIANLEREIEQMRCAIQDVINADISFCRAIGNEEYAKRFEKLRDDFDGIEGRSRLSIYQVAREMQKAKGPKTT